MAVSSVTKAVIPAAGLGTRFLPATKAQPKEMLPVVDKPAIQYVVEEAVRRRHRRHPHHHRPRQARPRGPLRPQLRARALPRASATSTSSSKRCSSSPSWPTSTTSARASPSASATPCRWPASTSATTASWCMLGDDIMDHRSTVLTDMIKAHDHYGRSVIALSEFPPEEISSYGCVDPEVISDELVQVRGIVEKPEARGRAVEPRGDGPLRVHPRDLRGPRGRAARRRRRDPAHRRHRHAPARPRASTAGCSAAAATTSARSSTTCGPPSSWPLDRDDLGPEFRAFLVDFVEKRLT